MKTIKINQLYYKIVISDNLINYNITVHDTTLILEETLKENSVIS